MSILNYCKPNHPATRAFVKCVEEYAIDYKCIDEMSQCELLDIISYLLQALNKVHMWEFICDHKDSDQFHYLICRSFSMSTSQNYESYVSIALQEQAIDYFSNDIQELLDEIHCDHAA